MVSQRHHLCLEQLIEKYAVASVQEAFGLVPIIASRREHDSVKFLMKIGSEISITEPLADLRNEARKCLIRQILSKMLITIGTTSDDLKDIVCCIDFFAASRAHCGGSNARDMQTIQTFLQRCYKTSAPLDLSSDNFLRAVVNSSYYEFLLSENWVEAIPLLQDCLIQEMNRLHPEEIYGIQSLWFNHSYLPENHVILSEQLRESGYDLVRISLLCGHILRRSSAVELRPICSTLLQLAAVATSRLHEEMKKRRSLSSGKIPTDFFLLPEAK